MGALLQTCVAIFIFLVPAFTLIWIVAVIAELASDDD